MPELNNNPPFEPRRREEVHYSDKDLMDMTERERICPSCGATTKPHLTGGLMLMCSFCGVDSYPQDWKPTIMNPEPYGPLPEKPKPSPIRELPSPMIQILLDVLSIRVKWPAPDDEKALIRTDCQLLPGTPPVGEGPTIAESLAVLFARCIAQGAGSAPHDDFKWCEYMRQALREAGI